MTALDLGVQVVCDGPDASRDCPTSAAIVPRTTSLTALEVRVDGEAYGWTVRRRSGRLVDLCPDCRLAP